jgi:hypothetical protein
MGFLLDLMANSGNAWLLLIISSTLLTGYFLFNWIKTSKNLSLFKKALG